MRWVRSRYEKLLDAQASVHERTLGVLEERTRNLIEAYEKQIAAMQKELQEYRALVVSLKPEIAMAFTSTLYHVRESERPPQPVEGGVNPEEGPVIHSWEDQADAEFKEGEEEARRRTLDRLAKYGPVPPVM